MHCSRWGGKVENRPLVAAFTEMFQRYYRQQYYLDVKIIPHKNSFQGLIESDLTDYNHLVHYRLIKLLIHFMCIQKSQ